MRDLYAILRGGYCTRWHANPDLAHIRETLAEHHARVAQIILALHPDPTIALIDAALHHDMGEVATGDWPLPFKQQNPDIAEAGAAFEAEERFRLGCHAALAADDRHWLNLADRIAAYAHVAHVNPALRNRPDWRQSRAEILQLVDLLGVERGPVWCLLQEEIPA